MANLSKVKGNLLYVLKHNTREVERPSNKEIDSSKSGLNYYLTPESHGRTAVESKEYYEKRLSEVYTVNSKRLVTACSWVVTAPKDLDPSEHRKFFESSYKFITGCCGGEDACIQAIVHCDEGLKGPEGKWMGETHMHLTFIPEIKNHSYISKEDKLLAGIEAAKEMYDLEISVEDTAELDKIISRYERSTSSKKERDAIHGFSEILDLKRDDARWVFTRCRRLESEKYERRVCYDDLIDKKFLCNFHPNFQKYLDEEGINATVHSGVTGGRSRSVEELKKETKEALISNQREIISSLEKEKEALQEKVVSLEKQVEKMHEKTWGYGWEDREWTR